MLKWLCLLSVSLAASVVLAAPLDDYVYAPDPSYNYTLLKVYDMDLYKIHILNMTSLKWLNESYFDNPIWWHYLAIVIPNKVLRPDAAFLWIYGTDNTDSIPTPSERRLSTMSMVSLGTGIITAVLFQTPNQPLVFLNDPNRVQRSEDQIIGWSWRMFLNNLDHPEVIALFPMTKAAVRGMDATTEFVSNTASINIKEFYVGGESKRGWATWLTAAVDKRVSAAVPVVMDLMSMSSCFHSHFKSLGGWTFAFWPYYELNITTQVDSFELYSLEKLIDPKMYFDRFRNKKILAITTAGDEFFLPEDTYAAWKDLVAATDGTVLFRRIPNAEHLLIGHEISVVFSIRSFLLTIYDKKPLPVISWSRSTNVTHGIIEAIVDITNGLVPYDVRVYYAKTIDGKRKDFRLAAASPNDPTQPIIHPVPWEPTKNFLTTNATSTKIIYKSAFLKPITGWFAFFIQFSFISVDNSVIQVTTETNVFPQTYPFDDCTLDSCYGKLV